MITVLIAESYRCVGTCTTSFNDEGACLIAELPWTNVVDFAIADGQAEQLTEDEFYGEVNPDPFVEKEIDDHECEFMQADGVYVIYDVDTDTHYFFA
jgi:hypothetical protein